MKKISIFLSLLVLVLNFQVCASNETVVYENDFESIKLEGLPDETWTYNINDKSQNNYTEVTVDPDNSENKVLDIYSNGKSGIIWAYKNFEPIGGTVYIEYKVRFNASGSNIAYIGNIAGVCNIMVYMNGYTIGTEGVANIAATNDKWHTVKLEIDLVEKRYNCYIDTDLVRDNKVLTNPEIESIDKIALGVSSCEAWIDDVKISYTGGIVKNYTKLSMEEYFYNTTLKGIYNIPVDTTPKMLLNNITFVEDAIYGVYEQDGETPYKKRFIDDTAVLRVQSPDFTQDLRVKLHPQPWKASVSTVKTAYNSIIAFDDSCDLLIKNKKQYIDENNTDVKSYTKNGKLFVPLRAICENLGLKVGYDEKTKSITVNGKAVECETENLFGRTFLKAEDLAEITDTKLLLNEDGIACFSPKETFIEEKLLKFFKQELNLRKE